MGPMPTPQAWVRTTYSRNEQNYSIATAQATNGTLFVSYSVKHAEDI